MNHSFFQFSCVTWPWLDDIICGICIFIESLDEVTPSIGDHLQITRSKSETKRNGFSILFDFKIHSTIWNDLSVSETFLRVNEYP
jgi:hypothetical protein